MFNLVNRNQQKQRNKQRRYGLYILVIIYSISLLLTPFAASKQRLEATEDPWTEILRIKEEQEEIARQKEILEQEIAIFEDEEAVKNSEYAWILERSEEEREKYLTRVNQLYRVYMTMESVKLSLAQAIEVYEQKKAQYGERIATMFQMQEKSLLELFLEAETLEGFFTTVKFMRIVTAADEEALAEMKRAAENLDQQRKLAEGDYQEMAKVVDALEKDILAMQEQVAEAEAEALAVQNELLQRAESLTSYNALSEELQAQLREYELSMRGMYHQNINLNFNGILGWPCPGYNTITSGFGHRSIPSIGLYDFHTGLDMAAAPGTPVYAAASGYVYFAAYWNIAGNTVRIDHGDGLHTLYCHLSGFNCYDGQMVNAGDLIGFVGNTGLSTGPHLHFEVQVNGVPVDPSIYLY